MDSYEFSQFKELLIVGMVDHINDRPPGQQYGFIRTLNMSNQVLSDMAGRYNVPYKAIMVNDVLLRVMPEEYSIASIKEGDFHVSLRKSLRPDLTLKKGRYVSILNQQNPI